jgi:hypothetical protein
MARRSPAAPGEKLALMLPGPRSMLAAMAATAILVTPIGIALLPAPTDPRSAGFPRVEQPVVPQELEQNVKRQGSARRAAELTKLLTLSEPPAPTTAESRAASEASDGRSSPRITTPERLRNDAADAGTIVSSAPLASQPRPACADVQRSVTRSENANAQPEMRATGVAAVGLAIESTPRAKSPRAHLHARRRIRLIRRTRADAPPAAAPSNADSNTFAHGTVSTSAFPVAPPASGGSRGSAF